VAQKPFSLRASTKHLNQFAQFLLVVNQKNSLISLFSFQPSFKSIEVFLNVSNHKNGLAF